MNQVGLQRNQTPSGNYALNIKTRSTRYALDRVLTLKFSGLSCLTNYWHKGLCLIRPLKLKSPSMKYNGVQLIVGKKYRIYALGPYQMLPDCNDKQLFVWQGCVFEIDSSGNVIRQPPPYLRN
jgi:hypothetical protein